MELTNIKASIFLIIATIVIMMFGHYEAGGESWGYWFFANELKEGNGFVIPSRAPIYTAYLQLFNWIVHPYSFIIEWFVTSLITGYSVYLLLKIKLSAWYSLAAIILWLPFIRYNEPPVQSLALAVTCLAFVIRSDLNTTHNNRFKFSASYALLIMAYMFRVTYIVPLILVILYDGWVIYKSNSFIGLGKALTPKKVDWPIAMVLIFLILSYLFLSSHPWNNAWFATTSWFPVSGEHTSLGNGGFIQSMNWQYIAYKYGSFENYDFYFTNKELFDGATTILEALKNNYTFILEQWWRNLITLFDNIVGMNFITHSIARLIPGFGYIIGASLLLFGAFKISKDNKQFYLLLLGAILLVGLTIIGVPKARYLVPAVPLFILAGYWYSLTINKVVLPRIFNSKRSFLMSLLFMILIISIISAILFFDNKIVISAWNINIFHEYEEQWGWIIPAILSSYLLIFIVFILQSFLNNSAKQRLLLLRFFRSLVIPTLLLSFTQASYLWKEIIQNIVEPSELITFKEAMLNSAGREIVELSKSCEGILTMEHLILPIIIKNPNIKIYDIWEIPPFGNLDDSVYDGLNPNRVDCLFISDTLSKGQAGKATNQTIRYNNYIHPYELELLSNGASLYKINDYGRAIINKL